MSLGRLHAGEALGALTAGLGDPDAYVRSYSAQALALIGDRLAVRPLIPLLADADPGARQAALWALGTLTGQGLGYDMAAWTEWLRTEDRKTAAAGGPSPD
jgi:HEAT repeat protein